MSLGTVSEKYRKFIDLSLTYANDFNINSIDSGSTTKVLSLLLVFFKVSNFGDCETALVLFTLCNE